MKVGIATIYHAFNYGGYLQAYAMQKFLSELGMDTEFLNFNSIRYTMKRLRMLLIHKSIARSYFNLRLIPAYQGAWKQFNIAPQQYARSNTWYDAVVIGSDEIWNVRNRTFLHVPPYFGQALKTDKSIFYAPSCGASNYEELTQNPDAIHGLNQTQYLSGRDANTVSIIERITGRKAVQVLDPTFLYDLSRAEQPCTLPIRDYILIYSYGMDEAHVLRIQKFAKASGLQLVSAGVYHPWCDHNIAATPYQFLSLVRNAQYFITDTFHGTVFSILYQKNFAVATMNSLCSGREKVLSLLKDFDLLDRTVEQRSLEAVLEAPLDGSVLSFARRILRQQSISWLCNALKK